MRLRIELAAIAATILLLAPACSPVAPSPASVATPGGDAQESVAASQPSAPSGSPQPSITPASVRETEIPSRGAVVTLPLHVLARFPSRSDQVVVRLSWDDGTELTNSLPVLHEPDGSGAVIGSVNWLMESQPPQPKTQHARLTISDASGGTLSAQDVTVLSADDPGTQTIKLYWTAGENIQEIQRRVPRTPRIGSAALEELLWGPTPPNLAGFGTALPSPAEVLAYPGRTAEWGDRVRLVGLTVKDGLASANFSKEFQAYGGGSLRVRLIREQITRTLTQFPTVSRVEIAVEGETQGILEP